MENEKFLCGVMGIVLAGSLLVREQRIRQAENDKHVVVQHLYTFKWLNNRALDSRLRVCCRTQKTIHNYQFFTKAVLYKEIIINYY